jgi:predicted lipid-binding transport protein (Tim44 family)
LGKRDQFTVGVAAHEQHAIAQVEQAIKDRHRLRSGRVVTGDNDQVGFRELGLIQHRLQHR